MQTTKKHSPGLQTIVMQPTKKPSTQTRNNFVLERWRQSSDFPLVFYTLFYTIKAEEGDSLPIKWGAESKGAKRITHLPFCRFFSFPCCMQHLLQKAVSWYLVEDVKSTAIKRIQHIMFVFSSYPLPPLSVSTAHNCKEDRSGCSLAPHNPKLQISPPP